MGQGSTPKAPFSPIAALAFVAGIVAVQTLPALPPFWVDPVLALAALSALWFFPALRIPAWCLLGVAWAAWRADIGMASRLPRAWEGADVVVTGRIDGLPQRDDGAARFTFLVDSLSLDNTARSFSGAIRVSWYAPAPPLAPCETWVLHLRLKRPRSLLNPGSFDRERHALEQAIVATGYVREDVDNARAAPAPWCVDGARHALSQAMRRALGDNTASRLLRALAVGDQNDLDDGEWQVLRATGVGHLIAISGLHVGLLAGLGALLMRGLWKLFPRVGLRVPGPLLEVPAGLALATVYAAFAGFGLPTTRTLLMIAVVAVARGSRRSFSTAHALALAATAILLVDPLAVLSAGFWLSFVGVGFLMICLQGPPLAWWRELGKAQMAMSLGLLPLSAWFFGQSALVGPLANAIAVPFVSFVVVPLTLIGAALLMPLPMIGMPVLAVAKAAMAAQWWLLQLLARWPQAQWSLPEPSLVTFALASVGAIWMLLPRGVPLRWIGGVLFLPLLWPRQDLPNAGEFDVAMLDVGQGLSVLVRTREHALVYDAGARYPSGFDLGDAAVIPALHALGLRQIDRLIVSHGDNDHAGGALAVAAALHPPFIESGQPERLSLPAAPCRVGEVWTWEGVHFRMIGPVDPRSPADNDRSCVLLIEGEGTRLLLTGDIGEEAEPAIAAAIGAGPPLILAVAHHGSRHSSGEAFIDALKPVLALVSAGYRSRFGHPHPDVLRRFRERSIPLENTADSGCLRLRAGGAGPRWIERCRVDRAAYWRER